MPFSTARQQPLLKTSSRAGRRVGFTAILMLFASAILPDAAQAETRTLTIHHTHTREDITVTFKRNGRYDDAGLAKLNHFLRDWRNDEATKMDPRLFDIVWEVYQEVGAKEPIQIISAYRSPATNSMLRRRSRGVAKFSQHMLGKAMDFNIPGVPLDRIRNAGLRQQRGGVGFYPGSGSQFVHVDVGSVRHWPRLSPDALARVFPDGRTVHVPSDGRPLSGYTLALADVARRGATPSHTSVAAAQSAGIETADVPAKSRRGLFARFFGIGTDEDDDAREARTSARSRVKSDDAVASRVQLAAAVPMPRARPAERNAATLVASVRPNTPAQVVMARGLWHPAETLAAAESGTSTTVTPKPGEPQLVWQVGPQPAVTTEDSTLVSKRAPLPRPRPELAIAMAKTETTASVPWPLGERQDRVPSDLVLSYAAQATESPASFRAAAPVGSLRPSATLARKNAPARTAAAPRMPAAARLGENPWLRGVIMAPSVHASMGVTVLGPPNYRQLTSLMHKPKLAIANTFAESADFGLASDRFHGAAIGFIPLVEFGTITARLN